MILLEIRNITKRFGEIVAVDNLSLTVDKETIVGLIGPNGSGKTTLIDVVTGFFRDYLGQILFKGEDISKHKPHQIAKLKIGRTFQETRVFKKMTAFQNLLVASPREKPLKDREKAESLLKLADLYESRNLLAGNLSYGQQKLLELARVLMLDPELIFLDEPTAGINQVIIEEMLQHFNILRREGKTLVIVEHNTPLIFGLCQKVVVLDHGQKIAEGIPDEVARSKKVQDAYLGGG